MSSGHVRIDDELSLYCEMSGRGATTVLLIPGWTMTTAVFERQLEYFAGCADYRFVTCDPRAHGESTKTAGGHYYAQHGRDLEVSRPGFRYAAPAPSRPRQEPTCPETRATTSRSSRRIRPNRIPSFG